MILRQSFFVPNPQDLCQLLEVYFQQQLLEPKNSSSIQPIKLQQGQQNRPVLCHQWKHRCAKNTTADLSCAVSEHRHVLYTIACLETHLAHTLVSGADKDQDRAFATRQMFYASMFYASFS